MSAPKSTIKVKKNKEGGVDVTYEDFTDAANYYLFELTRAALRDVGKFVKTVFRTKFYEKFKRRTGAAGRACNYKVYSSKNTTAPRVEIGLKYAKSSGKSGREYGFYAFFQEFGTKKPNAHGYIVPKYGLLQHSVEDNILEIRKIEAQYLDYLNKDVAKIEAMINEKEYDDED